MKHIAFSLILPLTVVSLASAADPFTNLSGHGHANYNVYAATSHYGGGSMDTTDLYSPTSLYAGGGDYQNFYETWTYSYDIYIGDDIDGNPMYQTIDEDQIESAYAEAHAYSRFQRTGNTIDTEVYASSAQSYSYSGSQAFATTTAFGYGQADATFTFLVPTAVHITTTTSYGDGYLNLFRDGNFIRSSTDLISANWDTILPAGDYYVWGDANQGGANMSIEVVPEPATIAALGLGALGVLRRRKK